jgi:hypothetical protein
MVVTPPMADLRDTPGSWQSVFHAIPPLGGETTKNNATSDIPATVLP